MANASISIGGLEGMMARIHRVQGGGLQKDLVAELHKNAAPIRGDMDRAAFTPIQNKAMRSVKVERAPAGLTVVGGRGNSLPAVLFPGAEFGGRKSKKVLYLTRSRRGRPYSVRRRTTMQFLPHLGREGYFFWVTLRDWLPKLNKEQQATIAKALGG